MLARYRRTLGWALAHGPLMMFLLLATICLNFYLYVVVPKGFFPQQDTGRLIGTIQADQNISFYAMQQKLRDIIQIVRQDPAVEDVTGFTGGGQINSGMMFVTLKPKHVRNASVDRIMARLRIKLARIPGARTYFQPVQDIRVGGRSSGGLYQFTLQAEDLPTLRTWEKRIREALSKIPILVDVSTDEQDLGLQTAIDVNRDAASRLGVTMSAIDATLNDSFGQRQVSTIITP